MNVAKFNSTAWDETAETSEWSVPVDSVTVAEARDGKWSVVLTPVKPVPREWFPKEMKGVRILCLASGGGQQAPIFAAAGAEVTSFDNSAGQLERDRMVAEREGLRIRIEQGDAADLSRFESSSFDHIFHPVSNVFFPDLEPVWREAYRVLRPGGTMLSGFMNPVVFMFDFDNENEQEVLKAKYALPYSDLTSKSADDLARQIEANIPIEFGHTLEKQIGGQISAGFVITGFYEDHWSDDATILNRLTATSMATRAVKPS
jgi:SAM-dependent methyltransferase